MNQLITTARELLAINDDLPYRMNHAGYDPLIDDFEWYTFEQTWPSTELGFGGVGGQALTSANTYVFIPKDDVDGQKCHVYFGDKYAYSAEYNDRFIIDLYGLHMASVMESGRYRTVCAE